MGWFLFEFSVIACLRVKIPRFYTDSNARTASRFVVKTAFGRFTRHEDLKTDIRSGIHKELTS
tara:strand:+ start:9964 stop:10152 length:189 start_codon:yes stop_codon:yes gene_type:complete